jgi:hypothetical protein
MPAGDAPGDGASPLKAGFQDCTGEFVLPARRRKHAGEAPIGSDVWRASDEAVRSLVFLEGVAVDFLRHASADFRGVDLPQGDIVPHSEECGHARRFAQLHHGA